jgi:nickel/cobalt exporter
VLVLGLVLSLSASVAGDRVTALLGVASGALIAAIGVGLLVGAFRRRRIDRSAPEHGHDQHEHDHEHGHDHHEHEHGHRAGNRRRRAGLVGMGVAGGLVPSPSALVVLLGAVALGRTAFGVLLVVTYGLGMAATLTAAGLLLVTVSDRWRGRFPAMTRSGARLAGATPLMTALLVVVVGMGLATRSLVVV